MANNIEKFILEFGVADKNAIDGFKRLNKKIESFQKSVNKNIVKDKKRQYTQEQKFQDAVSQEKLRDVKRENAAKEKAHKEELRRLKQIETARRRMLRSDAFQSLAGQDPKRAKQFQERFSQLASKKDIEGIRDLNKELSRTSSEMKRLRRQQLSLTGVQNGLTDSTRNLLRAYVSVFALFEGTTAINRIGQDFEGMRASMLASSGGARQAKKDLEFVRNEAVRLGLDLRDATDNFVKFQFAAKEVMTQEETRALFTGFSEFATALQLSPQRYEKALTSLQQMMNKSQLMAEEVKQQMGEQAPGSIQVFARALDMTTTEFFAAMEAGELMAGDVLPKVATEFAKAARQGGALSAAMETARISQRQFTTASQEAADEIFQAGFGEGLASFFDAMVVNLNNFDEGIEGLGSTYEAFFNILKRVINGLTPLLNVFFDLLGRVGDILNTLLDNRFSEWAVSIGAVVLAVRSLNKAMQTLGITTSAVLRKFTALFVIFEEIAAVFDPEKTGVLEQGLFGGKQTQNLGVSDLLGTLPVIGNAVRDQQQGTISGVPVNVFIDGVEATVEKSSDGRTARATLPGAY